MAAWAFTVLIPDDSLRRISQPSSFSGGILAAHVSSVKLCSEHAKLWRPDAWNHHGLSGTTDRRSVCGQLRECSAGRGRRPIFGPLRIRPASYLVIQGTIKIGAGFGKMTATAKPVFRFAPSPNGRLHAGHAFSAVVTALAARRADGRLLLRIEDIDIARCRETYVDAVYADLAWLGLKWETPVLRQSQHFERYQAAADRLRDMGLLYPCFASRAEIMKASAAAGMGHDPDGAPLYPGLHRELSKVEIANRKAEGQAFAMRLDMAKACEFAVQLLDGRALEFSEQINPIAGEVRARGVLERVVARPERWGDVVIQRKDVGTSYHLSVVVDDAHQGVSHVTRGRDLFAATDVHRLLQVLLGFEAPIYHHHMLISDDLGRKLSKSSGDTCLSALRDAGVRPGDIHEMVEAAYAE